MRSYLGSFCCFVAAVLAAPASLVQENSPGEPLADLAREADKATIEFYSPSGKKEVTFSDSKWIDRLAGTLEVGSYSRRSHCLCISYPQIRLYRQKELLVTFSVHHGEKLRAYAGPISGDFQVGAFMGKVITDLANEKNGDSKPPAAGPGRAEAKHYPTADEMKAAMRPIKEFLATASGGDRPSIEEGLRKLGMSVGADYKPNRFLASAGLYDEPEVSSASLVADLRFDDSGHLVEHAVNVTTLTFCGVRSEKREYAQGALQPKK